MDFSSLGVLVYLILAFVIPGFCYLLASALCFPCSFTNVLRPPGALSPDIWISFLGVIGGLLLSSVCFAIETLLDRQRQMKKWFPEMDLKQMAKIEAAGKGTFFLQLLSGSAIMHFNIGLGFVLIWITYVASLLYQLYFPEPACDMGKHQHPLLVSGVVLVIAIANLRVSYWLRNRFNETLP